MTFYTLITMHKKWRFPLRTSSVNMSKYEVSADLVTFTEEILNDKLHFLCSVNHFLILLECLGVTFRHISDEVASIYLLKINNRNTRTKSEICSKLTIKTPEQRHWRRSGVFIANFEHILHFVLVFLLLTLNK